ncbi:MAG: M48 family metallopeptidase [Candidatus Obscuribacterales bacterium]|nr:M48 family metallopeptidase [Candidatus Obscuribacterales bacterium]
MSNFSRENPSFRATGEMAAISAATVIEATGPSPAEAAMSEADKLFLKRMAAAEELSKTNPSLYQVKILSWALLGYSFMIVMPILMVVLALTLLFLAFKFHVGFYAAKPLLLLLLGLMAAVGCYLKALFLPFPQTEGEELKPTDYPDLFKNVRELSARAGVKVDRIFLNYQVNAAVVERPRFGLFGFYENHLMIGLPLMMILSPDEFKSVISHEFGHLAEGHSRKRKWIYQMSGRWQTILEALSRSESLLLGLNLKFYSWFCPYFLALTRIIMRQHEREADELAVRLAGAECHARSFLQIIARGDRYSNYEINCLLREYPHDSSPPLDFYRRLQKRLTAPITDKLAAIDALEADLLAKPSPYDSHPPHAERIACCEKVSTLNHLLPRLKAEKLIDRFSLMEPVQETALEYFFGAQYDHLMEFCCQDWAKVNEASWKERSEDIKKREARNAELEKKRSDGQELSLEEELELVVNVHVLKGEAGAMPLYEDLYKRYPEDPIVAFQLAVHSYYEMRDKERGLELFGKVAKHGKTYRSEACAHLLNHYDKAHDHANFREFEKLYTQYAEEDQKYQIERSIVSGADQFKAHSATAEEVEKIRAAVAVQPVIKAAYLIEKQMAVAPEDRMFVLVVRLKVDPEGFGGDSSGAVTQATLAKLCDDVPFPAAGYVYIVPSGGDFVLKAAKSMENGLIYGRN